ncbi:MAG: zinc-ribbon domain-containing protein [Deltaproteobacteria bacterium]|jgi:predicted Zn finger-like uncharacterized protein|nr:zinc-ribbon domain-containing protein [Deltaproteobacteria bacterium]
MITTCPNCHTEFNIPDAAYRPGRKARCAVCSHVFVLPETPGVTAPSAQPVQIEQPVQPEQAIQPPQTGVAEPAAQTRQQPGLAAAPEQPEEDDLTPMGAAFDDLLRHDPEPDQAEESDEPEQPEPAQPGNQAAAQSAKPEQPDNLDVEAAVDFGANYAAAAEASAVGWTAAEAETDGEATPDPAGPKNFSDSELDAVLNATAFKSAFKAAEAALKSDDSKNGDRNEARRERGGRRAAAEASVEPAAEPAGRGKKTFLLLAVLICLAGVGFGGYYIFQSFSSSGTSGDGNTEAISMDPAALEKVRHLDVQSNGIKYDYISNERLGKILVLEGKVTNNYSTPKDNIVVEARLLNSKGVVLKSQRQICGVLLTPLQLTALGQQELLKALNNRIEIMANNINVVPGASVPYMVVFIYPPDDTVEFEVSAVDASDPPPVE